MKKLAEIGHIRKSNLKDLDRILELIETGKEIQRNSGNLHQWCDEPPVKNKIISDINLGRSYVFDDGSIYGTFMFTTEPDPSYEYIEDGAWLNDESYGVIHRICSDQTHAQILHTAIEFAKKNCNNIRIDTHPDNSIMKHLLKNEGFIKVGIVYIDKKLRREAYHLTKSC